MKLKYFAVMVMVIGMVGCEKEPPKVAVELLNTDEIQAASADAYKKNNIQVPSAPAEGSKQK